MKPPIAWYGGKTRLAPWVISHFPPHRIYVEPFGGSGAVLFAKKPAKIEVYNDLHLGVVNFYRCLRDPAKAAELQRLLELTPYSRAEFNACRAELKETEPLDPEGCVRYAWAFAVYSYQGFGHRADKEGNTFGTNGPENISNGTTKSIGAVESQVQRLGKAAARLLRCELENSNALTILERYDTAQTLIYADPPYTDDTGDSSYTHKVDHEALLSWLLGCKSMVVLSGMDNPLYNEALVGWERAGLERMVSAANPNDTGGKRPRKTEVLWLNPACQAARLAEQPTLFGGAE